MEATPDTRESCQACGAVMDVSGIAPFTMVECPHCDGQTRVKSRFGPFTLVRRHAIGGMSMVFVARDEMLGRDVALKILSEDYSANERRIAAFEQEARLTASLSHPNVVRVFTTGRAFGRFYIAMELVPGGHLEERIHDLGKIPEAEMLPLAIEVARGLKAAKAAGLIHRDVKPGNILLDADGHAKLVDFGLALVTQGGKARAEELWATPYYVPPETVEGGEEDFRSDIYAFGATLFHTLAGKPPCGEDSMSTDALREAKKRVPPLERIDPTISTETCRLVNKAMSYQAADRHASYDELIADLNSALARLKGSGAHSKSKTARLRSRLRRKKILVPAAMLGVAALAGALWFARSLSDRVPPDLEAAINVPPAVEPPPVGLVDHSSQIASAFREARTALASSDYEKAAREFAALHQNPHVQEPTRTWAGVESVMAAFLDGRSAAARKAAATTLEHLNSLPGNHELADGAWARLLKGVGGNKPLAADPPEANASSMLATMLAGLKNWEQGMTDTGARSFQKVAETKLPPEDEWALIYQKKAADYLIDHEVLKDPVFKVQPVDADACREAITRIEELMPTLKTRGRAKYNLRARQLDLKRQLRLISAKVAKLAAAAAAIPPPPPLDEVMVRLDGYMANFDFNAAIAYLKELPADPPGARRASLVALAGIANAFLNDLGAGLADEPFVGDLQTKDGRALKKLIAAPDGALLGVKAGGGNIECKWTDFTADALIELHRILVKRENVDARRERRHEAAIAFDWFAGDRQRALGAAKFLANNNPDFGKRWNELADGLPD